MYAIEFDQPGRTVLVIFEGELDEADLDSLDEIADVLVEAEGEHGVILDFSGVTSLRLTPEGVAARGRRPGRAGVVRRVIVAPPGPLGDLAGLFARSQAESGTKPPTVVASRAAAMDLLKLEKPSFRPVDIDWLRAAILHDRKALSGE